VLVLFETLIPIVEPVTKLFLILVFELSLMSIADPLVEVACTFEMVAFRVWFTNIPEPSPLFSIIKPLIVVPEAKVPLMVNIAVPDGFEDVIFVPTLLIMFNGLFMTKCRFS